MPTRAPDAPAPSVALLPGLLLDGAEPVRRLAAGAVAIGLGVAAVVAWMGAVSAGLLIAVFVVPTVLVVVTASRGRTVAALAGAVAGVVAGAAALVLRAMVWPGPTIPAWIGPQLTDLVGPAVAIVVGVVISQLIAGAMGGGDPLRRAAVAAVVAAAFAAGESLVATWPLLTGAGLANAQVMSWWALGLTVGLIKPALFGLGAALAAAASGVSRLGAILGAAATWSAYLAGSVLLVPLGAQPLGTVLAAVWGLTLCWLLALRLDRRARRLSGVATHLPDLRQARLVLAAGAALCLVIGLVLAGKSPAPGGAFLKVPTSRVAPAEGALSIVLDHGVTVSLPSPWVLRPGGGNSVAVVSHPSGVTGVVTVVSQPDDAVPLCEHTLSEATHALAVSRLGGCKQGAILGRVDTATGWLSGMYAAPLPTTQALTAFVGTGHRFDGLSVRVVVQARPGAADDVASLSSAQELVGAALSGLDAAP